MTKKFEKPEKAIKSFMTIGEVAEFMGISKSYLYKLTMEKTIPHYKPLGKKIYFKREDVEEFLFRNRIATDEELEQAAQNYCLKKGGAK